MRQVTDRLGFKSPAGLPMGSSRGFVDAKATGAVPFKLHTTSLCCVEPSTVPGALSAVLAEAGLPALLGLGSLPSTRGPGRHTLPSKAEGGWTRGSLEV